MKFDDQYPSHSTELNSLYCESDLSRMLSTHSVIRESCALSSAFIDELDIASKMASEIEVITDATALAQAASATAIYAKALNAATDCNSALQSLIRSSAYSCNLQAFVDANFAAQEYAVWNSVGAATSVTAAFEAASPKHFEQYANSIAASAASSVQSIEQPCFSGDLLEDWAPSVLNNDSYWEDFVDKAKNVCIDKPLDDGYSLFNEIWVDELTRNSFREYLSSESIRRSLFETSHELAHNFLPRSPSKNDSRFTPAGKLFSERFAKRILEYAFEKAEYFVFDGECIFGLVKQFVDKRLAKVYRHSLFATTGIQFFIGTYTWVRTNMIHSSTAPPKHGFLNQDFELNRALIGVEYDKSNRRSAIGTDQIDIRSSRFIETRYRENSATAQSAFGSWQLVRHQRFHQSCRNGAKPFRSTCIEALGDHIRVGRNRISHLRSAA